MSALCLENMVSIILHLLYWSYFLFLGIALKPINTAVIVISIIIIYLIVSKWLKLRTRTAMRSIQVIMFTPRYAGAGTKEKYVLFIQTSSIPLR